MNRFVTLLIILFLSTHLWGQINRKDVDSFVQSYMDTAMDEYHLPGFVFVMVHDGEIFLSKGIGFADISENRPVDPEKTLFRVGSLSKLVTATAAMKLVDDGLLDLSADINKYLKDFQIEEKFGAPITMRDLLIHTSGIDERAIGLLAATEADELSLSEYLSRRLPQRIRPPGEFISYSNIGYGLIAHIIENISGVSFNDFVYQRILEPLGMNSSGFEILPEFQMNTAMGYKYNWNKDQYIEDPLCVADNYNNTIGDASFVTTGSDMAKFMIAHLSGTILNEKTSQLMLTPQYKHHPQMTGRAFGFMENSLNGYTVLDHTGDWYSFSSRLVLIPETNSGFFFSNNRENKKFYREFMQAFMDRFYPDRNGSEPSEYTSSGKNTEIEGYYRHNRYPSSSYVKIGVLFGFIGSQKKVEYNREGNLIINGDEFIEVEHLLFKEVDGDKLISFVKTELNYTMVSSNDAYHHINWFDRTEVHFMLLALALISFVVYLFYQLFIFIYNKVKNVNIKMTKEGILGKVFLLSSSFLFITFLIVFAIPVITDAYGVTKGVSTMTKISFNIGIIASICAVINLPITILIWKNQVWSLIERILYTETTIWTIVFVCFMLYWNLLGFQYSM